MVGQAGWYSPPSQPANIVNFQIPHRSPPATHCICMLVNCAGSSIILSPTSPTSKVRAWCPILRLVEGLCDLQYIQRWKLNTSLLLNLLPFPASAAFVEPNRVRGRLYGVLVDPDRSWIDDRTNWTLAPRARHTPLGPPCENSPCRSPKREIHDFGASL